MRLAKLTVLIVAAVASAGVLGLAGCAPDRPPIVPTSMPSVAPPFASNAEALAAAKAAYENYFTTTEKILSEGGRDPDRLRTFVTPSIFKTEMQGFKDQASKGWHSSGAPTIDPVILESYFPDATDGVDIVTIYACVDLSNVDVLDSHGQSVVPSTRPDSTTLEASFDLKRSPSTTLILSRQQPWTGASICTK
jgi:hypothetical protein